MKLQVEKINLRKVLVPSGTGILRSVVQLIALRVVAFVQTRDSITNIELRKQFPNEISVSMARKMMDELVKAGIVGGLISSRKGVTVFTPF